MSEQDDADLTLTHIEEMVYRITEVVDVMWFVKFGEWPTDENVERKKAELEGTDRDH